MTIAAGSWLSPQISQRVLDAAVAMMLAVAVGTLVVYPDFGSWGPHVSVCVGWLCLVVASMGLLTHRPTARGWYWATGCIAAGVASNQWLILIGRAGDYAFPPVWIGYLVCYACGIWALVNHMRGWSSLRKLNIALNSLITTVGAMSVIGSIAYVALRQDGIDSATKGMAFGTLALDAVLINLVAKMWFSQAVSRWSVRLLAMVPLTLLASDTARLIDFTPQYVVDIRWAQAWQFAFVFIAWATTRPSVQEIDLVRLDAQGEIGDSQTLVVTLSLAAPALLVLGFGLMGISLSWIVIGGSQFVLAVLAGLRIWLLLRTVASRTEQIERLARSDPLTGVANRRRWDNALEETFARIERDPEVGARTWVGMLDLDCFKRFNDAHGHQAGDQLLRSAVAAWGAQLELAPIDQALLARYGGEEFGILLVLAPEAASRDISGVLDPLRHATPLGETCSIGVARWRQGDTPDLILGRADGAMYAAKRNGRNRLEVAAIGLEAPETRLDLDRPTHLPR